ncbi:MAG: hypothetical protein QM784_29440 [Polyangiaceae bacterium]
MYPRARANNDYVAAVRAIETFRYDGATNLIGDDPRDDDVACSELRLAERFMELLRDVLHVVRHHFTIADVLCSQEWDSRASIVLRCRTYVSYRDALCGLTEWNMGSHPNIPSSSSKSLAISASSLRSFFRIFFGDSYSTSS